MPSRQKYRAASKCGRDPFIRLAGGGSVPSPFACECVSFFGEAVQIFGIPRSVGQIYGLLFASPVPLSFSDIAGNLEISKGSASQGLQLLRSLGAVVPVTPSDRPSAHGPDSGAPRVIYEPELGLRRLFGGVLRGRLNPLLGRGRERMQHLQELANETGEGTRRNFYLERVKQLEAWRIQALRMLPVFRLLLKTPLR